MGFFVFEIFVSFRRQICYTVFEKMTPDTAEPNRLDHSFNSVRDRVEKALQRSHRTSKSLEIVAVSKNATIPQMIQAWNAGFFQFGESRVQQASLKKIEFQKQLSAPEKDRWHMIGHLQSNKVSLAVNLFDLVQSVDSVRLATLLNAEGERRARPVSCLVEVKISEEPAKSGIPWGTLGSFFQQTASLSFLRIEGLMGLAPWFEDPEKTRPYFARLRNLFEKHRPHFLLGRPILSMGMSRDFHVAIEEGSTMIRVGSALFK